MTLLIAMKCVGSAVYDNAERRPDRVMATV